MRTDAGLVTLSDKVNDFHKTREVVLDKMHEDESIENFRKIGKRYGAWMEIKWEEQARVEVFSADRATFEKVIADGRKAIAELRHRLAGNDVIAAKTAGKQVKKAYKGLFFLDSAS